MEWYLGVGFEVVFSIIKKKNLWGNLGNGVADDFPKLSIYR